MWFGTKTLKDFFESFKKDPSYVNAEILRDEAKKREKIVKKIAIGYGKQNRELENEIEDKLVNKLIDIALEAEHFMKGMRSSESVIAMLEKNVGEYEKSFERFDKSLKKHIEEIKARLKEEYEVLQAEKMAA